MLVLLMNILSILFICSSLSFWTMWLGLEMFNFFFIPWLMTDCNYMKSTKIFYYFTIQVIASGFFLISSCNQNSTLLYFFLMMSMIIKLGSFPFHLWVLSVVESMDWNKYTFFLTLSKLGPLSIMSWINPKIFYMIILSMGSMSIPLTGLKTTSLRKILAYSSIAHMGWLLLTLSLSKSLFFFYIVLYWTILFIVCVYFNKKTVKVLMDILYKGIDPFWGVILVLTLMGMPPLMGFFPKLFTLKYLVDSSLYTEALFISLLSLIPFFFYLQLILCTYLSFNYKNKSFMVNKNYFYSFYKILFFMVFSIDLLIMYFL